MLVAPPGVGLTEIVSSLSHKKASGKDGDSTEVFHVEGVLLEMVDWADVKYTLTDRSSIRDILRVNTRREIMKMWIDAFKFCVDQVKNSDADHKVIAFHPSLYSARRNEQYSTVSWIQPVADLPKVDRVVLLIDDIYDMWDRLAIDKSGILFHDQWLYRRLQAQKLDHVIQFVDAKKETIKAQHGYDRQFNHLVADSANAILGRVLGWRHLDMIEAEALASSVQAPLTVLGVKHPMAALEKIVKTPETMTVYLSHPISRPRRRRNAGEDWPPVVNDSNELSSRFAQKEVVLVCPTAIDEFRLAQPANKDSILDRRFELTERWPRLVPSDEAISAGGPASDKLSRISLSEGHNKKAVGAIARAIESAIYAEVPFRDHFLVTHTDGFLVFRPLYEVGHFSDGVKAEATHWRDLAEIEPNRRALFVHSLQDFKCAETVLRDTTTRDNVHHLMISYLQSRKLRANEIEAIVAKTILKSEMLDAEVASAKKISDVSADALEYATLHLFFPGLTYLQSDWITDDRVGIVIESDDRPSDYLLQQYANFFHRRPHSLNLSFRDCLQSALGMPLSEWSLRQLSAASESYEQSMA